MAAQVEPFQFPNPIPGCDCAICQRVGVENDKIQPAAPIFFQFKIQKVDGWVSRDLSAQELAEFESKQQRHAEWLKPYDKQTWVKSLLRVIRAVKALRQAKPFCVPVDWQALGILDYPQIIKHPMDLGTIEKKIQEGFYKDPDACISDLRLVFRNCHLYNKPGTAIHAWGEDCSKVLEEQLLALAGAPLR